jgi:hypothetical protein
MAHLTGAHPSRSGQLIDWALQDLPVPRLQTRRDHYSDVATAIESPSGFAPAQLTRRYAIDR